jgi:hypothetical protein
MAQRRVERTVVEGKGDDICTEESNRVGRVIIEVTQRRAESRHVNINRDHPTTIDEVTKPDRDTARPAPTVKNDVVPTQVRQEESRIRVGRSVDELALEGRAVASIRKWPCGECTSVLAG